MLEIWLACSTIWPGKIFQNKLFKYKFDGLVIAIRGFPQTFSVGKPSSILAVRSLSQTSRVVGKCRCARTQTQTRTHTILKYTFAFIQQFIPTAVNNAVFASKPGRWSYSSFNPFICACAVERQYATWHPMPSSVVQVL